MFRRFTSKVSVILLGMSLGLANRGFAAIAITPTAVPQTAAAILSSGSPAVWYAFAALAGEVFRFDPGVEIGPSQGDVFDNSGGSGNALATASGSGSSNSNYRPAVWNLDFKAPESRTYFLRIAVVGTTTNQAILTLTYAKVGQVVRTTAQGRVRIVNNVLRTASGERAIVNLAGGTPFGTVHVTLMSAAGWVYGLLDTVQLDANGGGTTTVGGRSVAIGAKGVPPLKSGVYWILATGAVQDRQPLLIVATTADLK